VSAALVLLVVFGLWMAFAVGGGWPAPVAAATGAVAAVAVVLVALRLRIAGAVEGRAWARAPVFAAAALARAPRHARDALRVLASALGARARRPVFVRLKLRPADPAGAAAVVAAISGAPGAVVIDADAASLLAHALHEEDVNVAELQALERRALAAAGSRT
jgi:multisubunit Na+/H+ antiporter MnhE subunit